MVHEKGPSGSRIFNFGIKDFNSGISGTGFWDILGFPFSAHFHIYITFLVCKEIIDKQVSSKTKHKREPHSNMRK